jgi:hypothetical protein
MQSCAHQRSRSGGRQAASKTHTLHDSVAGLGCQADTRAHNGGERGGNIPLVNYTTTRSSTCSPNASRFATCRERVRREAPLTSEGMCPHSTRHRRSHRTCGPSGAKAPRSANRLVMRRAYSPIQLRRGDRPGRACLGKSLATCSHRIPRSLTTPHTLRNDNPGGTEAAKPLSSPNAEAGLPLI